MSANQYKKSGEDTTIPEGIAKCTVTCPMCGHRHVQYRMNPHSYWFSTTELDRKPSGYQSRQSMKGYYAPLYELWHCPKCHYTAHNRIFPDPLKHIYIEKTVVRRRLAEHKGTHAEFVRVLEILGKDIAFENMDFSRAIRLALLAVYFDLFIADLLNQNSAVVAGSFLRLAWLFRDWPNRDADYTENLGRLNQMFDELSSYWPDCPRTEHDALDAACNWFEKTAPQDALESVGITLHIAQIRLQMGDKEGARIHLTDCSRKAVEEAQQIQRLLTENLHTDQMPAEERGHLITQERKLRSIVEECRGFMDDLRREETNREMERARAVAAKHPHAAPTSLRALLEKENIPPSIIQKLVPEKNAGGGLFGGLFRS